MNGLNALLLAAHDAGDRDALTVLYTRAADLAETDDAACFFLTQAYVYALEQGHPTQELLYARLAAHGRV